jgi:hypothetical protein
MRRRRHFTLRQKLFELIPSAGCLNSSRRTISISASAPARLEYQKRDVTNSYIKTAYFDTKYGHIGQVWPFFESWFGRTQAGEIGRTLGAVI